VEDALTTAEMILAGFPPARVAESSKRGGDPVTEVDYEIDDALRNLLQRPGEGWLSEETADDLARLDHRMVWVVDPLDGTREFIDGLPEFSVSIAAVVDGVAVVGGVTNPAANIRVTGAMGVGVHLNGETALKRPLVAALAELTVLASRTEWNRGIWEPVTSSGMNVVPMGSVAYKLARVAAGLDDVTWTPVPKNEWDVAAGAALVAASGGVAVDLSGAPLQFNLENTLLEGVVATSAGARDHVGRILALAERQRAGKD